LNGVKIKYFMKVYKRVNPTVNAGFIEKDYA